MKTLNKILLLAGILLIGFYSCKKEEEHTEVMRKDITGAVTKGGAAVSGAVVSISGGITTTTTTDASGNYRFYSVTEGSYEVDATYKDAQGFNFQSAGATVVVGNQEGEVKVDLTVE